MKTLYESILDDEDALVGGLKKDANNPFIQLKYILIENLKDAKDRTKEVEELIKKPIIDVVKKHPSLRGRKIWMRFSYYKYSGGLQYMLCFMDDDNNSQEAITITASNKDRCMSVGLNFTLDKSVKKYDTDTLVDNINKTLKKEYGFRDSGYNSHIVELDF
jgi:hypothetical protein